MSDKRSTKDLIAMVREHPSYRCSHEPRHYMQCRRCNIQRLADRLEEVEEERRHLAMAIAQEGAEVAERVASLALALRNPDSPERYGTEQDSPWHDEHGEDCGCRYCHCFNRTEHGAVCRDCRNGAHQG